MPKFQTIHVFQNPFQAEVVKGRLLSENIPCHILDQNIQFSLGPTINQGFRLQVNTEDVVRAKFILNKTLQEQEK